MENFQPSVSFKPLKESRAIKFSVDEPEIDDINEFYIQIKVTKSKTKMVERALKESAGLNIFQRK